MKLFTLRTTLGTLSIVLFFSPIVNSQQAVSGIITDYNSYWKSSVTNLNPTKPDNRHNLLAFTHNGVTYSTGVNDGVLTSHNETFSAQDFWALPIDNISGAITYNTKVGLGEKADGVHNGASNPAPTYGISTYLTDGIKGLDLGTCIANLPQGSMTFFVNTINPSNIGDGIPDILVTQIADPSGSTDNYSFTTDNNLLVGNSMNIVFTNITPVGTWTADFYEATSNPLVLTSGFTNTDRPLRLWAADFSEFGITTANYKSVKRFKINLSGNSDVAFVGYNARSINLVSILPVTLNNFKGNAVNNNNHLSWETKSELNTEAFEIEKSIDGISFEKIGVVAAKGNSNEALVYSYTDKSSGAGINYYRLKMIDKDGKYSYSPVVQIKNASKEISISLFPNPATDKININHPFTTQAAKATIYSSNGTVVYTRVITTGVTRTTLDLQPLNKGVYYLTWEDNNIKQSQMIVLR